VLCCSYLTVYIATTETPASIEEYLLDDHGLTAYTDYASHFSHEVAVKSGKAKVNEVKVEMEYCSTDNVAHASFWQAPTCVRQWTLDCKQGKCCDNNSNNNCLLVLVLITVFACRLHPLYCHNG
jgi:hypothetical protein